MDAVEPDGIACAGGMTATDPLCTEPFKNTAIAALKVTTEPGFVFTGWIVDGAHIEIASADPLFLTTMPLLASNGPVMNCPQNTTEQVSCQRIQINTDSNNDGSIDAQVDDPIEEVSGKMIDYQDTAARIPVQLIAEGVELLDDTFSLEVAASSGGSHLLAWESETATEPLTLPKSYALDALPSTVYVSGCKTSDCGPGDVKLALRLVQQRDGNPKKTVLEDRSVLSVLDVAQIAGTFRIIGYEGQAEYEMKLTEEPDGNDRFFRTLGGMRLHLQAVTLPNVSVETYTWSADQGKFFSSYSVNAAELTGEALNGANLTDIYWEGEYRPDVEVTISLSLHILGESEPHLFTRKITSRVLKLLDTRQNGDDVRMLQACLRNIGISQGLDTECDNPNTTNVEKCWGWRNTPVAIDGVFGGGGERAVNRLRERDQIGQTGEVDLTALQKIQEHWQDYLAAFEAYPTEPIINDLAPDPATHFEMWLDAGATTLGETLTDAYMTQISSTVTRKDILRAWVKKEAAAGHWGYKDNWAAERKVPYRIVLGGYDNNGSIGFSQVQNRFKYGEDDSISDTGEKVLKDVNLYHPEDAMKGFAIWSNTSDLEGMGGGFYRAFVSNDFMRTKTYSPAIYPNLGTTYTDQVVDRLSKGLGAYHRGVSVGSKLFLNEIWPEILRSYSPAQSGKVQEAIRYALEVKQNAGLSLADRTWTWYINASTSFDYSEDDWFTGISWDEKKP